MYSLVPTMMTAVQAFYVGNEMRQDLTGVFLHVLSMQIAQVRISTCLFARRIAIAGKRYVLDICAEKIKIAVHLHHIAEVLQVNLEPLSAPVYVQRTRIV